MDIKGIAKQFIPAAILRKGEAKTTNAADAENEKEGNGQSGGEDRKRRRITDDELAAAIKHIESLPGVKENFLRLRVEKKEDTIVVYVEDGDGKTVRRIPEQELIAMMSQKQQKKGNLLNRAM